MSEEVDDFLAHYGVKGMKWGKRKAKEPAEDEESEAGAKRSYPKLTKKQAIIGASILVGVAVATVVILNRGDIKASMIGAPMQLRRNSADNRISAVLRRHGDRKDIALPQGQVFSRISTVAETNVRDVSYVAYGKKDIADYKAHYGSGGKYQVKIQSQGEVRIPSRKNRVSTISEMMDSPLASPDHKGQTLREVLLNQERSAKGRAYLNTASSRKLAGLVNDRLDTDDYKSGYGKEFIDRLKDKGYSAITDPIDGYSDRKTASIIIDSGMFKVMGSKKLTTEDITQAKAEFRKLLQN